MSFKLQKDVDFAWVTANFGSGSESYKITHYPIPLMLQLIKKHGHRDPYIWKHKETNLTVDIDPKDEENYLRVDKIYPKNNYDITDAEAIALRKEAICIVLLDWKPGVIQDKDGKDVLCGEKEKKQLVIDSPARIDWIISEAIPPKTFRPDQEQEAKNSEGLLNIENEASETKSNSRTAESVST